MAVGGPYRVTFDGGVGVSVCLQASSSVDLFRSVRVHGYWLGVMRPIQE